jgi:hypothetical protein
MNRMVTAADMRDVGRLLSRLKSDETLFWWHCRCGYANVRYDPCLGCHCRAPRIVRRNTRADRARRVAEAAAAVARAEGF